MREIQSPWKWIVWTTNQKYKAIFVQGWMAPTEIDRCAERIFISVFVFGISFGIPRRASLASDSESVRKTIQNERKISSGGAQGADFRAKGLAGMG